MQVRRVSIHPISSADSGRAVLAGLRALNRMSAAWRAAAATLSGRPLVGRSFIVAGTP